GEVQGVFAAARDVTDRKRAEEELQRYSDHLEAIVEERTAQLKDAERLAGIGETAAMIGHDLRNPLQALQFSLELERMYFDAMAPEVRESPKAVKTIQLFSNMEQQIQYMDKIVSDLQDYARPLQLEREEVSVAALIDSALSVLTIPESISVHVDVAPSITVTVDAHFMQRVITNLITNAVQAMPQGGELTVGAAVKDGAVAITVQDTGEGVPEDMKETLFSPLATGKAKGTGLGLAVVKRIVEAHGGTIEFESDEGKGTTFTVTLPQTAD
ncbi:MAG: ATP-binding protein, partial [Euryarchaeota archaeon]|nr:ATP-binding protein [Euryarchaeota archaeon]